ncbi:PorV/PorQ family protein [candidate division KSB1 bacterium]|nr:PorV/PorQ family protein [candidate division KSB1 bacterium]
MIKNRILFILILMALISVPLHGGHTVNQVFVGARPMAMGEAFVALANDGNALYWNPAGLASLNHYEINSMYANLYQTGINNNYISLVGPYNDALALGADWFNIGFDDDELGYQQNQMNFSVSYKFANYLYLGANLKYLNTNTTLDGNTEANGSGWAGDIGVLAPVGKRWRLGVMAHDLFEPEMTYKNGVKDKIRNRIFRFGAAFQARHNMLLAMDVDDRLHLGGEYLWRNLLALRGGLQKDLYTDESMTYSFGFGIRWQFINMDYAYTLSPTLENTSRFSLGFFFDLFASKVRIENSHLKQIFPSQYKQYTANPFGSVEIVNVDEEPIQAKLSVYIPKFMSQPSERNIIVRPKIKDHFDVHALLHEDILLLSDDIATPISLAVSYRTDKRTFEDKYNTSLIVYNKNAIRWTLDVTAAASFVTSTDASIESFVGAASLSEEKFSKGFPGDHLEKAMRLFSALSMQNIEYIPDPNTPYQVVSQTAMAVDNIKYPYETLTQKRGDCDDLTVLYAALLENNRIPAAILSIPEHLFLMFNSGIPQNQHLVLGLERDLYVIHENMVWIPVEVTSLKASFFKAWKTGAEKFNQYHSRNQVEIIPIHQAWQHYPAVQPKAPKKQFSFDRQALITLAETNLDGFEEENERFLQQRRLSPSLAESERKKNANELGTYHALRDQPQKSVDILRQGLIRSEDASLLNNLGNAFLMQGLTDSAISCYESAQQLEPEDGGIYLNLGIASLSYGDTLAADELFSMAKDRYETLSDFYGQIGLVDQGMKAQKGAIDDANRQELLQRFEKIEQQKKPEIADIDPSRQATSLRSTINIETIGGYLYWKPMDH